MSKENQKQETLDQGQHKKSLRERDPKEWKARKKRRQERKDAVRMVAKKSGIKLGRWRNSVAWAKNQQNICGTVGSPNIPAGFTVFEGGAK